MRFAKIILCLLFFCVTIATQRSFTQSPTQKRVVIAASTVLDGKGRVLHNTRIVIEGSKIVAIDPKAGPVDYDLRGLTVMPGWIDAHVHVTWIFGKDGKNAGQGGTQVIAFSPNSQFLASGGWDNQIHLPLRADPDTAPWRIRFPFHAAARPLRSRPPASRPWPRNRRDCGSSPFVRFAEEDVLMNRNARRRAPDPRRPKAARYLATSEPPDRLQRQAKRAVKASVEHGSSRENRIQMGASLLARLYGKPDARHGS